MAEYKQLINGKLVDGESTFEVINPSTAKPFTSVPHASQAQVEEAIVSAKAAFKLWRDESLQNRQAMMKKAADVLEQNSNKIVEVLVKEQGKPVSGATGEVALAIGHMRKCAEMELPVDVYSDTDSFRVEVHRRPIGVVAGITPWNFPVFCSVQKWAPAITFGNTFVHKPSPFTPVSGLLIGMLLQDVFPPGVFNVVTGADFGKPFNVGAFLTGHALVNKVSFTGSGPTGKKIMSACAQDVKRVTLELGGNDAAIIRADCDVKEVAPRVFGAAMANTGQICCALKRAYVHRSIYDAFVEELANCARNAKVGDGFAEGTQFGPLNNQRQLDIVTELVEDAKKRNAKIVAGGERVPGQAGYFYPPTIIAGVGKGFRIVDEEQFGPVLPVIPFDTDEEALEWVNDSPYGLGGSVWSADKCCANKLAAKIEAGTVWVNDHLAITGAPFGGFKQSGLGRELGKADIDAFTESQTIRIAK